MAQGTGMEVSPGRDRLLIALLAAGLLLRLLIAWSPFSYLAHRGPLIDDAFYSFSIARNLAAGHGPTADGIHATSGFQPLYTFLLVPFYLLSPRDAILPVHLALTLLALCGTLTGWFLYRLVSRAAGRRAGLFSLALWTFGPYFLFQGENGLETGLFGMCLAGTLAFHLSVRSRPTAGRLCALGFLLGVTILARVDGVLLALALALDLLLLRRPLKEKLSGVALATALAVATLSPYLLFLWVRFGVLIPESGSAVRFLSLCYGTLFVLGPRSALFFPPDQVPVIYYVGSLRKAVQILLGEPLLFPSSLLLYPASAARFFNPRTLLLVLGGGILMAANLLPLRQRPKTAGQGTPGGLLRVGVFCAALWIPAYAFGVLGQWWFNRYLFPLFLLMAAASGPLVDRLGASLPPFRRMGPARFALLALGLHLACFLTQVPDQFLRNKPYQNVSEYMAAARTLDLALPPGSVGGAFQSGTVGYFARHRVINLDGVVNRDAARALREKRMADYIREEGIEAIIDWPRWFDALLIRRSPPGAGRNLGPAQPAGRFLLIRVEPPHNRVAALPPYR